MSAVTVDTLVFGGGVAGLWTLRALRDAGVDAWLVEKDTLGAAQSMQAQGIVHGGGKYALRRVGDVEAIRQIREMPARWRRHHAGEASPSLEAAELSSPRCWLWLPRGSWSARLEALTLLPLMRHGGVLATRPASAPRGTWPEPLQESAHRAYSMEEPVFEPASVIRALAGPVADRLLHGRLAAGAHLARSGGEYAFALTDGEVQVDVRARCVVACAGAGNADLLEAAGHDRARMQRRPLRMGMLRGDLPALHGHCVLGGRTRLTITSVDLAPADRVWQVGGELAERFAETDDDAFFGVMRKELARALPGLSLSGTRVADYAAVRAEAANAAMRRPSGVQVEAVEEGFIVAWPTKWAMAPLLAEEVLPQVVAGAREQNDPDRFADWPRAECGRPPWEEATWRDESSVAPD